MGYQITVLDNLNPQIHGKNPNHCPLYQSIKNKVNFIFGDVTVKKDWHKAINGQDVIIHLTAETGTGQSMYEISKYVKVNVGGTAALWDVLANNPHTIKKVIVASSRAIYGEGLYRCQKTCGLITAEPRTKTQLETGQFEPFCPKCRGLAFPVATAETAVPNPASLYACTKLAQEQMSLTLGKAQKIAVKILRFQNVYGPGQSLQNPYTGIISIFSNQLRQNLPINIFEDGLESRDFVFIDDIVKICTKAIDLKSDSIVVNAGSGKPTTVLKLANTLKQLWESQSSITVTGAFRVGDIRHNWADLTELKALWPNWKETPLDIGLKHFVKWAKGQPVFKDKTHRAEQKLKSRNL